MAKKDLPIEPDYNRFIPPIIDEVIEEKTEDDWNGEVVENEDGSATIIDPEEEPADTAFGLNLAEVAGTGELSRLAIDYIEAIDRDLQARSKRDEQYEEGIRRTGLGSDAPGGAQFQGASKVVHPVLAEGCVDFASRAIKEIYPPSGPVRTKIVGKQDGKTLKKSTRKRDFLNWQLTKQCPEFFTEMEQMLSQLPLGGSQYIKVIPNFKEKRPEFEFVPVDKLVVPFAAAGLYTAQRVTHIQELTENEFETRIEDGYYRDIGVFTPNDPDETKSQKATEKIEGKEKTAYNEDGLRTVYEIATYARLDFDPLTKGKLAPYIIVVDKTEDTVLAIYRNWDEEDESMKKLDWTIEFKFIPWRGALGIGLPHLIGGLAAALTGSLRALLDSAHVNNAPTALKMKGSRLTGQSQSVEITQIQEIEAAVGVDDIRKLVMPMPFNAPSQVLFNLLDWLTNAAKGVVSTAEERIADASNQMPVGTALALIEQGSTNYSAIHMRLHNSVGKLLEIVCRVNYSIVDEELIQEALGDDAFNPEDFESNDDVMPVSDPNIFSESQRYAQNQAVMQLMEQGMAMGVKYNQYEVHRRALELLKINDADDILPPVHKAREMNAIAENVTAMLGNDLIVVPDQDHFSHIKTHLTFITDPNYGANPLVINKCSPIMHEHIAQHIAFMYADACESVANGMAPMGAGQIQEMDKFFATIAQTVTQGSPMLFGPIQQGMQQAKMLLQQNMTPPPEDPAIKVQRDIGMAEIQRQTQKDQGELSLKAQKQEEDVRRSQEEMQLTLQEQQQKLAQQQIDNEKEIEKLRQAAEKLRTEATDMLHRAATEQQRIELERKQQEADYMLKVAELRQRETEFLQKQLAEKSKIDLDVIQGMLSRGETELPEPEPEPTLGEELAPVLEAIAGQQQGMMEMQKGMMEALAHLGKALSAPKVVVRDSKGKAVGVQTVVENGE